MHEEPQAGNMPVTLEDVIANRDARVERQKAMLAPGKGAVVSFTVNMPGPVKDTENARSIFHAGLQSVIACATTAGWDVLEWQAIFPKTGPEALFLVDAGHVAVKEAMVVIEESHPLGRLFDLDVLDPKGAPVARKEGGRQLRACLLCGEPAAVCGRSRAHSFEELTCRITAMVADFQAQRSV